MYEFVFYLHGVIRFRPGRDIQCEEEDIHYCYSGKTTAYGMILRGVHGAGGFATPSGLFPGYTRLNREDTARGLAAEGQAAIVYEEGSSSP